MKNEFTLTFDQLPEIVDCFVAVMPECSIFTFQGPLGAGKTTIIQRILKKCGISDVMPSPTFTYLNWYVNQKGQTFYHFDLYRMESLDDFLQAGFDEYLYEENSWSFIEWPEIIAPLLKKSICAVTIDYEGLDKRKIRYQIY